jgi:CheY-specific phosphatase CheX
VRLSGKTMTGCVQISGAWDGAVTIQCSPDLARAAAAAMLEMEAAATSFDDVRDALGEIANMVGGNLKALLPGPTNLSLPLVVEGEHGSPSIREGVALHAVWFSFLGEAFVVCLHSRSGAPQGARHFPDTR